MDFNKLKDISRKLGGILVMQGNEPDFVVLSYEQFRALEVPAESPVPTLRDEELIDALNKEILALKEEIRQKETAELVQEEAVI